MKHFDHSIDLSASGFTDTSLQGSESFEVGEFLQITLQILLGFLGSIGFLDGFSGRFFLVAAFLSFFLIVAFGCGGSCGGIFFFALQRHKAFLFFVPFFGWVENGSFRRSHITQNQRNRRSLLDSHNGFAGFLVERLAS